MFFKFKLNTQSFVLKLCVCVGVYVCFGVLKHDELRHRMVFYHANTLNPHAALLQAKGCVSMRHKGP